jgi:hypothetical protein
MPRVLIREFTAHYPQVKNSLDNGAIFSENKSKRKNVPRGALSDLQGS